jgi:hypothetical protein
MWKTSSFMELDGGQQHSLRTLYQSYFYGRQVRRRRATYLLRHSAVFLFETAL